MKIELPPKVKCWRCTNGQVTVVVGEVQPGPDISEKMAGKPLYGFEPCDCSAGERYDLGGLYGAIEAAGATPDSVKLPEDGEPDYLAIITRLGDEDREDLVVEARGNSHEEATLSAIVKCNG